MPITGAKTENKHCRKCRWCAKFDDYSVLANTHTPVYYCVAGDFYSKKKPNMTPTFENDCPCFSEPYKDDREDD